MDDNKTPEENNPVVNRLRSEGQLTRNTGTNSIKSIRIDLQKFESVFDVMQNQLKIQTAVLQDTLRITEDKLQLDRDNIDRQLTKERLESVQNDTISAQTRSGPTATGPANRTPEPAPAGSPSWLQSLMFGIGPGLGTFIGTVLGRFSAVTPRLGSTLLRAIPLTVLAPAIGNFIADFIQEGLRGIGFGSNEDTRAGLESFRGEIAGAASLGAIGSIFGLRIGALFFGGDLIRRSLDSIFDNDSAIGTIAESAGLAITPEMQNNIGSALGAGIGLALPKIIRRIGFIPLLLGGILVFGDQIRNSLTDMFTNMGLDNPDTLANFTVDAATAATLGITGMRLGAMFGPGGALVGAAVGFTLGLGFMIKNWLDRQRESARERFQGFLDETNVDDIRQEVVDAANEGRLPDIPGMGATRTGEFPTAIADRIFRPENIQSDLNFLEDAPDNVLFQDLVEQHIQELIDRIESSDNDVEAERMRSSLSQLIVRVNDLAENVNDGQTRANLLAMIMPSGSLERALVGDGPSLEPYDLGESIIGPERPNEVYQRSNRDIEIEPLRRPELVLQDDAILLETPELTTRPNPVLTSIIDTVSRAATTMTTNILMAPTTVSPVTSISQGGSNVSSVTNNAVTSYGGGAAGAFGAVGMGRFAN